MFRTLTAFIICCGVSATQALPPLRPPATPLIAHDTYFSVWSATDKLTDGPTKHWTGAAQPLAGMIRVDGKAYRFLGDSPRDLPAAEQRLFELAPTRTIYKFLAGGVELFLTFFTPALPEDLDILSRPVTYVTMEARAADGRDHAVALYFDCSALLAKNTPEQRMTWARVKIGDLTALRVGTAEQPVLAKSGDDLRIDWGYLYLAAASQPALEMAAMSGRDRRVFATSGNLPDADELETLPNVHEQIVLAARFDLGNVGSAAVSRRLMVAYDDLFSIQYFQRNLRPWWRRSGMGAAELLRAAAQDHDALLDRAKRFDEELTADMVRAGGPKYAQIAILAYRQALAAHKLVADLDGTPLYFPKENFSNGCIGTVDVFYPSSPLFLLLSPKLLEAQMRPALDYAMLPRWPWRYAPHDLGTYPLANGQVYGGAEQSEENQMPVEESGNMLILAAALAKTQGSAQLAGKYWPLLTKWAEYLREKGMDPENQLSTDDFAGHLAHNTNLSLKAIEGLAGYAQLAGMLGKRDVQAEYERIARGMAGKWVTTADDGDHFRLAFDKPGTWSQKYNLVWDRLLGLDLFPPEVARKEVAFYKTKQNTYGLPLDSRATYTKLDWILWTATLAEKPEDFAALTDPVFRFLNESPSRVPMTDCYYTLDGKQRSMQARSVVGGVFIKMLADPAVWKKWAERAR